MRKPFFAYAKTKTQISFAVTVKLISTFVLATRIVQSLFFLNPKFQASSYLLWLYSPDCVGNPENWFSHKEAHICFFQCFKILELYMLTLTQISRVDFPILINWVSPLSFLGAAGVMFLFYFIFNEIRDSK